jgi:hypothetical protein
MKYTMSKHAKAKVIKKCLGDTEDISHMFNQMLGAEDPEIDIVREKHGVLMAKTAMIEKMLRSALDTVIMRLFGESQAEACAEIATFADTVPVMCECKGVEEDMVKCYVAMKRCQVISHFVKTCKILMEHQPGLEAEAFRPYVMRMPSLDLVPFSFSSLDIKSVFVDDLEVSKYFVILLKIILDNCSAIYKAVASPDIDVEAFSEVIMRSISQLEGVPELNRCKKAFDKIKQSVGLLVGNFDGYYKDFIQSQNVSSIMENFIFDVSKGAKSDPQESRQFRAIIQYYRKATQGKVKDPKIQKLFEALGNFGGDADASI